MLKAAPQNFRAEMKLVLTTLAAAILLSGCGGSLYKVKPVIALPPLAETVQSVEAGGMTLRAAPLLTDEESQELFEANLPLGGVLPLRLELINASGAPIELKRIRFHLRDGAGKEWKFLSTKKAISRILDANQVYLYNPHSRTQFVKEFRAYELDVKKPLDSTERKRQGFIFFQAPEKQSVASPRGLVLTVEGLPQPAELRLN